MGEREEISSEVTESEVCHNNKRNEMAGKRREGIDHKTEGRSR